MKKFAFSAILLINMLYGAVVSETEPNNTYTQANSINVTDIGSGNLNWQQRDYTDWWKFIPNEDGVLVIYTTDSTADIDAIITDDRLRIINYDDRYDNNIFLTTSVKGGEEYKLALILQNRSNTDYNLHFFFLPSKNISDFRAIFNRNLNGKLDAIGNHNICVTNDGKNCINLVSADNNNVYQNYINVDTEAENNGFINSSEADLNLLSNDKVIKAYLFWQGRIKTNTPNDTTSIIDANKVKFKTPTTNGYINIEANETSFNWYLGSDGVFDYGAYADVTPYVTKAGQYYVANLQVSKGFNTAGGWSLVIVSKNPNDKYKKIVVYQGFQAIYNALGYPKSVTQNLSGFYTPVSGTVNANFILFANETDKSLSDSVTLTDKDGNKHYLGNKLNPYFNVLNGTISKFGENVVNRNPNFVNTLGTDIDDFNVSNIFDNSQTETNITITSNGDRVFLEMFALSVQLYVPKVCYYDFNLYDSNGNLIPSNSQVKVGDKVKVKYKVKNIENEIAKNVYINYPFDENNVTSYERNSTNVKNVLSSDFIHINDNEKVGNLGVYVNNSELRIGILGDENNEFLPYSLNPEYNAGIEFNVTVQNEGNLTFNFYTDYNYVLGNRIYTYTGVLPKCSDFNNNYSAYNPKIGPFNVVHYQPNITDDPVDVNNPINDLYTQISSKDFNITIVKLKDDNHTLENYTGFIKLDLIPEPKNELECKTLPPVAPSKFIAFNNESKKHITYVLQNRAYDKLRFRVTYLTGTDGCVQSMIDMITNFNPQTMYNMFRTCTSCGITCANAMMNCTSLNNCENGLNTCLSCIFSKESVDSVCSRDNFAIRPDKFVMLQVNKKIKAGNDFNITMKAIDANGNPVSNYNQTIYINSKNSPLIDYKDTNKNALKGILSGNNLQFVGGIATPVLSYTEVGEVNITLKELNGSEFAKVDEKDTPWDKRAITSSSQIVTFIPDHFKIDANYNNFRNSNFTYISKDLNMSSILDINITAQNKQYQVTRNYSNGLYSKDIDINISYDVPSFLKNKIDYMGILLDKIIKLKIGENINLPFSKYKFSSGVASLSLKINFDKNYSNPVSEFNLTINDINVSDEDNVTSNINLSQNALFRYGRIDIKNIIGYGNELNSTIKYEYYTPNGWVLNKEHIDSAFGDINLSKSYYPSNVVTINLGAISKGEENITFSTTRVPYSAKIHFGIDSWLWYHPLAKDYQDPSATNLDCLTHPCVSVTFESNSKGWGGIGIKSDKYNESKRTSEVNSSKVTTDKNSLKKINW